MRPICGVGALAAVLGGACTQPSRPSPEHGAATPVEPRAPDPEPVADALPEPEPTPTGQPDPRFLSHAELVALGYSVEEKGTTQTLVCKGTRCFCIEPLSCGDDCISLEENLKIFREALGRNKGRVVHCDRGEVGTCGALKYFEFQGDIHRFETRFFGPDGLIAQHNSTDYPEYCDGGAMHVWRGGVPKCEPMTRQALICGTAPRRLRPPPQWVAEWAR